MEGIIDDGALETLISITGASEAVGTHLLRATGGDLNAAVNAYYNEGDIIIPLPHSADTERDDWMDEDDPHIAIPVQSAATFRLPGPFPQTGPPQYPNEEFTSSEVGAPRSAPYGRGGLFRTGQRPEVRNIPIDWGDETKDAGPSYPNLGGVSNPRIEEVPEDVDSELPPTQHQVVVEEEVPSTASSVFRSGGSAYSDDDIDVGYNPGAPQIAEVPVMGVDEGIDIEEEMLRAAIEASRREAEDVTRRGPTDFVQESVGVNSVEGFPARRTTEDDDLARAVTLSLKTAEAEKAQRERGGGSSDPILMLDDDEDGPLSMDARNLVSMRRRGARDRTAMARGASAGVGVLSSARDRDRRNSGSRSSGSSTGAIISSPPDESEEVEEQPLLRRRISRRSIPSIPTTNERGITEGEIQARNQFPRGVVDPVESSILPSTSSLGSRDGVGGISNTSQQNDDPFASDEWGGISSEEHDEALMLEAALFGGLPDRTGLGLPYQTRHGMHNDLMDAFMGGDGANFVDPFNRRGFPQPPSPTVVAQRLIREQQDDEYLASLAADRIKELKAIEESQARRLKEQEAAEAAASQEKLRREEELKQQQEAEDLKRQLDLKKESLPLEPTADEQGALTLVVRLPDGSRRGRRFHKSNNLQSLFDFIDIGGGVKPGSYRLVRQYPRVAFTDKDHGSSLESLGLTSKQEVLFLETI